MSDMAAEALAFARDHQDYLESRLRASRERDPEAGCSGFQWFA